MRRRAAVAVEVCAGAAVFEKAEGLPLRIVGVAAEAVRREEMPARRTLRAARRAERAAWKRDAQIIRCGEHAWISVQSDPAELRRQWAASDPRPTYEVDQPEAVGGS
jgi:hypothetical protein